MQKENTRGGGGSLLSWLKDVQWKIDGQEIEKLHNCYENFSLGCSVQIGCRYGCVWWSEAWLICSWGGILQFRCIRITDGKLHWREIKQHGAYPGDPATVVLQALSCCTIHTPSPRACFISGVSHNFSLQADGSDPVPRLSSWPALRKSQLQSTARLSKSLNIVTMKMTFSFSRFKSKFYVYSFENRENYLGVK